MTSKYQKRGNATVPLNLDAANFLMQSNQLRQASVYSKVSNSKAGIHEASFSRESKSKSNCVSRRTNSKLTKSSATFSTSMVTSPVSSRSLMRSSVDQLNNVLHWHCAPKTKGEKYIPNKFLDQKSIDLMKKRRLIAYEES